LALEVFSQTVVMIEVANAAEVVRRKFCRPAAAAVSSGSTDESDRLVVGMKKKGMAKPSTNCGMAISQKVTSVLKKPRQSATPAIQNTPNETRARMSNRPIIFATIGDMITASTPLRQPA
jgi:hypothetical protein